MGVKMSPTVYARRLGVSHPAVFQAIQRGRLSKSLSKDAKGKTLIDVDIADREWGHNTDTENAGNHGAGGRPAAPKEPGQTALFKDALPPPGPGIASFGGKTTAQWRAAQMALATENEKLDLDVRKGKLADVEKIKSQWFNLVRVARDRLLMIPDRLSGELAAESDMKRVHAIIDTEIRAALTELTANGRAG